MKVAIRVKNCHCGAGLLAGGRLSQNHLNGSELVVNLSVCACLASKLLQAVD